MKKATKSKKPSKPKKAIEQSIIHNTSAGQMPNPNAPKHVLRKDARFAFKK
jgi:hypothetical protein